MTVIQKRVLINGLSISDKNTGVQYYSKYLFQEIKKLKCQSLDIDIIINKNALFSNALFRVFFEIFLLPLYLKKKRIKLYHATNYIIPFFIKSNTVVTVHDLITITHPELCKNTSNIYFKMMMRKSLDKAKKIIVVSETVKKDIIRIFSINPSKISVIHLGVNNCFKKKIDNTVKEKYNLPKNYLLFVGNIEAKKNIYRLIKAFVKFKGENNFDGKLILVGEIGWKVSSLKRLLKQEKIKNEVKLLGYVPLKDLPFIYSMAKLFVFPSIYEGFGIPPLEAMACEVPVLISKLGASPEICGKSSYQIDPYNINEMVEGMKALIYDETLRNEKITMGQKWVQQYTWEKTAKETIKIYEETCV